MSVLGVISRTIFKDACWYKILRVDSTTTKTVPQSDPRIVLVDQQDVSRANCPILREQAWYGGEGARVYAFLEEGEIAALCCYWFGERYRTRNFWKLHDGEAKLVQVITSPEMRGRGIATALIMQSSAQMFAHGYKTLYARVWFSNKPSLRAFETSGWRQIAQVIELQTPGMKIARKFVFRARKT